jgi:outer membrane protein TolC
MKKLLFLIIPVLIYAQSLKELIDLAITNNDLVAAKTFSQSSKSKELESKKSTYYPTVDIGGYYQKLDARTQMQPGDVYSAFTKVGVDVYDGGKKSSLINQTTHELKSTAFEKDDTKKSLALSITQDFFNIKSLNDTLESKIEAGNYLKAQLDRIKKFYEAELATKDNVDRFQASYDTNVYDIESIKLQILSLKKSLELKVGISVKNLDDSKFINPIGQSYEIADSLKALLAQKEAVVSSAQAIDSIYYPQIRVEDTYSLYEYGRTDNLHPKGEDNQNKLMLTLNMRLFDYGTVAKTKEAILMNSQALNSQITYKTKEQMMQYELAEFRIQTSKTKIKSAKSALVAANSAFKTVEEKFNAGIVDYVVYLDALTSKTTANSLYKTSLNDLEIAYAIYYFYSGKDIKEYIK